MKKVKLEDVLLINEDTLAGIDELVYNPVTRNPADEYDKGADGGVIQNSISWGGHEDHLHIGTTNRDVMIQIIDKANSMGLITTENPYAKRDPNGKVDQVHTSGSFHYKTFPGEPKVGAGVDISGNQNTIRELIRWINANYRGKSVQKDPTSEAPPAGDTNKEKKDTELSLGGSSGSTSGSTSISSSSVPSSDENVKRAYGFMTPFLSALEPLKQQMQDKINKLTQQESTTNDKKIINEVERIKNIMKL